MLEIQQNPAWSEEDDKICKAIIDNIQSICKEGYFVGNIGSDELIDWLKSLKDRYTWKPSEEQLRELENVFSPDTCSWDEDVLRELHEQLKQL